MSWPLGDTGVGKMGEMPPGASQEPSNKAAGTMASGHNRVSDQAFTAASISTLGGATPWARFPLVDRIRTERGRIQAAPICGCLQPIPVRPMPALRAADSQVPGPLPERRLQAVAVQLRRLGGFQSLARGR